MDSLKTNEIKEADDKQIFLSVKNKYLSLGTAWMAS